MAMKQSVIPLVITGVLAVAAGVAIAGLPSDPPGNEIIITELPTTTTTTLVIVPDTVSPLPTTAPTTTVDPAGTTTAAPLETTTTTTAPPPVSRPLVDRAELFVGTANAAGISGIATSTADALLALGYVNVQPSDAQNPASESVVYYAPEFAAEATRLAADLGWSITSTAPIAELPPITASAPFQLVALIGVDQVGPVDDL